MAIPSDEQLMAYADGLLKGSDAAEIERLADTDTKVAEKIEAFRETGRLARAAFAETADTPVPERLVAAIRETEISGGHNAGPETSRALAGPADRQRGNWLAGLLRPALPVAAAVVLAVGVGGYMIGLNEGGSGPDASSTVIAAGEMLPPEFARALDTALTGVPVGVTTPDRAPRQVTVRTTFRDRAGPWCREFTATGGDDAATNYAIACRTGSGQWETRVAVAPPPGEPAVGDGTFSPAGSEALDTLDAALEGMIDGRPLDVSAEKALIENGWVN